MKFKRLANNVSPYTHGIVNDIVFDQSTKRDYARPEMVLAKQLLADLPITPTSERIYDLTEQIQIGLLGDICEVADAHEHWQECIDRVNEYLLSINVRLKI